jgi:lipopolysaccharide export LptBFGC system permease protein LptF
MELLSQNFWIILVIFLASLAFIVYQRNNKKKEVEAQFVVATGCLLVVFYVICFLSGICTILNFLWNWIL